MIKEFYNKVIKHGFYDTRRYRYTSYVWDIYSEQTGSFIKVITIKRLPLKDLDTTSALVGWKTVKQIVEGVE